MALQITTTTLPSAFVGVEYSIQIAAGGALGIDGTYTWTVLPGDSTATEGLPPYDPETDNLDAYYNSSGLPRGLLWTYEDNVVTLSGTPENAAFDRWDSAPGTPVFSTVRFDLKFIVKYESSTSIEIANRVISLNITRIVDDSSVSIFFNEFAEPNDIVPEEMISVAIDGVYSSDKTADEKTAIINSLAKRIDYLFVKYDQDGQYRYYYQLLRDELVVFDSIGA